MCEATGLFHRLLVGDLPLMAIDRQWVNVIYGNSGHFSEIVAISGQMTVAY